jgi:hypothetical protein
VHAALGRQSLHAVMNLRVQNPARVPRGRLPVAGGIERAVETSAERVAGAGGVLVLLDADDDCRADLGPELLAWTETARRSMSVAVVLANHEFEAWIIAAAELLVGGHGFPRCLAAPTDPEKSGEPGTAHRAQDGRSYL